MFALPVCLIAGTLHLTATAFTLQTWNMVLGVFRLLTNLPEAGALLGAGICCFLLAWVFRRFEIRAHAR